MNSVIHKSATRGHANHGWLDTHHTFSFGQYYDPTRVNFGALRVLNDDIVDGGKGFWAASPRQHGDHINSPWQVIWSVRTMFRS
jgi:Pirin-related protein